MSAILDEGSLLFAAAAVIIANVLAGVTGAGGLGIGEEIALIICFLPAVILFVHVLDPRGRIGQSFAQDYVPLLTCFLMAQAAQALLLAVLGQALQPLGIQAAGMPGALGIGYVMALVFGSVLVVCATRVVFGTTFLKATIACLLAGAAFWAALLFVLPIVGGFLNILASPFLLYFLYRYLSADVRSLGDAFSARQRFRRYLEASTINPHDAEAQYQLGLIYQQRRQYTEAISRFQKAIEIDPTETDAHFQLGRIARQQGRFREALGYFQTVLNQNEKHSFSDAWKEIGGIHLAAKQYTDAKPELERFVDRRPYDPEGLYYLAETLIRLGQIEEGKEMARRAVEAARTAPGYRRGELRQWSSKAQSLL